MKGGFRKGRRDDLHSTIERPVYSISDAICNDTRRIIHATKFGGFRLFLDGDPEGEMWAEEAAREIGTRRVGQVLSRQQETRRPKLDTDDSVKGNRTAEIQIGYQLIQKRRPYCIITPFASVLVLSSP